MEVPTTVCGFLIVIEGESAIGESNGHVQKIKGSMCTRMFYSEFELRVKVVHSLKEVVLSIRAISQDIIIIDISEDLKIVVSEVRDGKLFIIVEDQNSISSS